MHKIDCWIVKLHVDTLNSKQEFHLVKFLEHQRSSNHCEQLYPSINFCILHPRRRQSCKNMFCSSADFSRCFGKEKVYFPCMEMWWTMSATSFLSAHDLALLCSVQYSAYLTETFFGYFETTAHPIFCWEDKNQQEEMSILWETKQCVSAVGTKQTQALYQNCICDK